ncbi:MAG: hypothetical protein KDE19_13320 [Caldilineaceae bacterium]|nr:hypothetical protein [Caldilineaceae bacterium]
MSYKHANRQQWNKLWARLSTAAPPTEQFTDRFDVLVQHYTESQRAYHTLTHVDECLAHFSAVHQLAAAPELVEAAIWLHDLIYEPTRNDNEAASAQLAESWLREVAVVPEKIKQISQLILDTAHSGPSASFTPGNPALLDRALLVDIDLAILGAPATRFAEYEAQIRHEYAWVPWPTFCQKRAALLQRFLDRPQIYQTAFFYEKFEAVARRNLQQSLQRLNR